MTVLLQIISALSLLLAATAADRPEDTRDYDFSVDVHIAMTGERDEVQQTWYTSTHIYSIDVSPMSGQAAWKVMHRFNDFLALSSELGNASFQDAPLPSRVVAPGVDAGQVVVGRRILLETWLQAVLKHPESQGRWKPALQKFLHPSAKPDKYMKDKVVEWIGDFFGMKTVVDAPAPDASTDLSGLDVEISMSGESEEIRGASHVFAIDVAPFVGKLRHS
jgi:hypothetical protein